MSAPHPDVAPLPAIPARHWRLGEELVYRLLIEWPTRRSFSRVWLKLDGPLPHPADGPLICAMNHVSWWDGYAAMLLQRKLLRRTFQPYLMMDVRQLRRYQFFTWLGVFSVDLEDREQARRSVAYIARRLAERRDRVLWIFPQGEILPNDQRPLRIYPGVATVAQRAGGARIWPVALRYEFRNEQRPELFIRCGPPHAAPAGERAALRDVRASLTAQVDALRDEVNAGQTQGYRLLMGGIPGINRLSDALTAAIRPRPAR
ncbi:glycerol acyltransferase [Chloroflexia bacterium SDU3-3]|nr:glycerol acyltransferase [Chloroflexia bacterium SDU3-3]